MPELLRDPMIVLEQEPGLPYVIARRTARPMANGAELEQTFANIERVLPMSKRRGMRLLMDLRDAPMRYDPAGEPLVARFRQRMLAGFDHTAVLVRSAVGRLQVSRYAREDGDANVSVWTDEAEARAHLLSMK